MQSSKNDEKNQVIWYMDIQSIVDDQLKFENHMQEKIKKAV